MSQKLEIHQIGKTRYMFMEDNLSIEVGYHYGRQCWAYNIEGKSYPSGGWRILDRGFEDNLEQIKPRIEDSLLNIKYGKYNIIFVTEIDKLLEEALFDEG